MQLQISVSLKKVILSAEVNKTSSIDKMGKKYSFYNVKDLCMFKIRYFLRNISPQSQTRIAVIRTEGTFGRTSILVIRSQRVKWLNLLKR